MSKEKKELIKKWEETGLLDDIDGILEKEDLVKLMESKATQLLREENQNKDERNNNNRIREAFSFNE